MPFYIIFRIINLNISFYIRFTTNIFKISTNYIQILEYFA